jgi:hypothetical protein
MLISFGIMKSSLTYHSYMVKSAALRTRFEPDGAGGNKGNKKGSKDPFMF